MLPCRGKRLWDFDLLEYISLLACFLLLLFLLKFAFWFTGYTYLPTIHTYIHTCINTVEGLVLMLRLYKVLAYILLS
jgi:hypothetical protein